MSNFIKAEALRLGFDACGISPAEDVPTPIQQTYLQWLQQGRQGTMHYLDHYLDKKFHPTQLVEGTQSIVSLALNYYPAELQDSDTYQLAWYAYGQDYHVVVKEKIQQLLQSIQQVYPEIQGRAFCDTAPVMEKYWAQKAGLGWQGKHTQLIIPHLGTTFFLGELFLNVELEYDEPCTKQCGSCHLCQQACPMNALYTDEQGNHLDASLCLSYLTIENKEDIPSEAQAKMGSYIYGCDRCQQACPYNKQKQPTSLEEFQPKKELLEMNKDDWKNLTVEQYRKLFKGSAVKRAKYNGLMRNIQAVQPIASDDSDSEPDTKQTGSQPQ